MSTTVRESVDREQSPHTSRRVSPAAEILLVLLLTLVAAIRLYKLGAWSFWVDEMFTMRDALDKSSFFHNFTYPLSYILIAASMQIWGVNEWAARIAPCAAGIITPAVVYLLARRDFGKAPAFIAALLIAISPWHLYWSQMSRFYTMTMLFGAMAALLFYSGMERNSPWRMVGAVVSMILAVMSHYSAFLVFAAIVVYTAALYVLKWPKQAGWTEPRTKPLLAFYLPFALAGMAMLPKVMFIFRSYSLSYATTGTTFTNPIKGAVYVAFSTLYRVEFAVAAVAILTAFYLLRRCDRRGLFLTSLAVVPLVLLVVAGYFSRGENRYALVTLPAFVLLAGIGAAAIYDSLRPRSWALAVILPLAVAMPLLQHSAVYFSSVSRGERWDYRAAAEVVRQQGRKGDMVLTPMYMPVDYYMEGSGIPVIGLKPKKMKTYLGYGKRLWFVVEDSTRGESAAAEVRGWLNKNADLIAGFPASSPVADYGVSVFLYEPEKMRVESRE